MEGKPLSNSIITSADDKSRVPQQQPQICRPWLTNGLGGNCVSSGIKTEVKIKEEVVVEEDHHDNVPFHSEEDDIEVFTFDRNSLKLKSEKVQRKRSVSSEHHHHQRHKINDSDSISSRPSNNKSNNSSSSSSSSSDSSSSDSSSDSEDDSDSSNSSSSGSSSSSSSSASSTSSSSSSCSSSGSSNKSSDNTQNSKAIIKIEKDKITPKVLQKVKGHNNGAVKTREPAAVKDTGTVVKIERDLDNLKQELRNGSSNNNHSKYASTRKSSRLAYQEDININKTFENRIKKKLRTLLKKQQSEWTEEDRTTIQSFPKFVSEVKKRLRKKEVASERLKESEDPPELLDKKCSQLASIISRSRYMLIYTGAGISTSAKIPDYRGPNGIWTLLQKGEELTQSLTDFSQTAEPTLTHMAIKELWERGLCKHVVSQNVDGLHLRSGIPKVALSEVHGNMYVEACTKCGREFVRLFDVTENTKRHHHKTGRFCYHCGFQLKDSIVLFGEKGSLRWPLNWEGAEYHADKADLILCLGSSLKVLRRYPWLWCMSKPAKARPRLVIVNLQWTPKDQFAQLKINGKCDEVMAKLMTLLHLEIPLYSRETDAIFTIATHLHDLEGFTKSTEQLKFPEGIPYPDKNKDLRNYIRFEPKFKVPIPYPKVQKLLNSRTSSSDNIKSGDDEEADSSGRSEDLSNLQGQGKDKPKKRVIKGNNFGWLGNTIANKQQKKRKLK